MPLLASVLAAWRFGNTFRARGADVAGMLQARAERARCCGSRITNSTSASGRDACGRGGRLPRPRLVGTAAGRRLGGAATCRRPETRPAAAAARAPAARTYRWAAAQVAMPRFCLELALWAKSQNAPSLPSIVRARGRVESSTGGFLS